MRAAAVTAGPAFAGPLASLAGVPWPAAFILAFAGLILGGVSAWRRESHVHAEVMSVVQTGTVVTFDMPAALAELRGRRGRHRR